MGSVLGQYATFRGRARSSEFWWYALFVVTLTLVTTGIDGALFGTTFAETGPLTLAVSLATLVPSLAVSWRRLHDIDRSGVWFFINLIPVAGTIIFLVFMCLDSHVGPNRFGPSPKHSQVL